MTNTVTKKPLRVQTDGTVWPYVWLPVAQLDDVRRLLDRHGIRYTVDELAISWDGGPEMIMISLGRNGDVNGVQKILDSIE